MARDKYKEIYTNAETKQSKIINFVYKRHHELATVLAAQYSLCGVEGREAIKLTVS